MPARVFYLDARSTSAATSSIKKADTLLAAVLDESKAVRKDDLVAVKVHFGELGNDAYLPPVFARSAAEAAKARGGKPFFTDTNTLYKGSRSDAVVHLNTASAHGYVPEVAGAPVVIADGLRSRDWREVALPSTCSRFTAAKIAGGILDADSMIVLSHVKGHEMAGFGGAIKNLAMGCAPFAGKREQHCVTFGVRHDRCVGCGLCAANCPADSISIEGGKATIERSACIGCGECQAHCAYRAVAMNWEVGLREFTEKMTEYALGAVHGKQGRVVYLSAVRQVVPACDCVPWSDLPLVPDQGYLASTDPVAIDQAAFDLISAAPVWPGSALEGKAGPGDDKFTALHPETLSELQMEHGERIGLGSRSYELIRL